MKQNIAERFKSLKISHVLTMVIFSIVFFGAVFGIIQYQKNAREAIEPKVEVLFPISGDSIESESTVLEGRVEDSKNIFVNSEEVDVNSEGEFIKEVQLSEGENVIKVTAKNGSKEASEEIIVNRIVSPVFTEEVTKTKNVSKNTSTLSSSGPETLWIPEITALSLAGASWYGSKKRLKKAVIR